MDTGRFLVCSLVLVLSACTHSENYQAFRESHDAIQLQMTFKEVFESGLANYLVSMKVKNIPGSTIVSEQPVNKDCKRYVFDIAYSRVTPDPGRFHIRVYCNQNTPSSVQVIPEQSFSDKEDLYEALGTSYKFRANSMRFRVESPPRHIGGVYDYYEFTINQDGRVASVSPIDG